MTVDNFVYYGLYPFRRGRNFYYLEDHSVSLNDKGIFTSNLIFDLSKDTIEIPIGFLRVAGSLRLKGEKDLVLPLHRVLLQNQYYAVKVNKFSRVLTIFGQSNSYIQIVRINNTFYYGSCCMIMDNDFNLLYMTTAEVDVNNKTIVKYNCRISPKVFEPDRKNNIVESRIIKLLMPSCANWEAPTNNFNYAFGADDLNSRETKARIIIEDMECFKTKAAPPSTNVINTASIRKVLQDNFSAIENGY